MKYAEVILPLPLDTPFTYAIPNAMEPFVKEHFRALVPLGKKRFYTGIVKAIFDEKPDPSYTCKEIEAVLGDSPVIHPWQIQFWEWIASYYLCKTGDVYKTALPTGLISNEKKYVPRKETCIRLSAICSDEEVLNALFDSLKRAKQQEQLLLRFIDMVRPFQPELTREISKKELLTKSNIHAAILDGLIKRGVLESYEKEISRIQRPSVECHTPNTLTEAQQTALTGIQDAFKTQSVCLLHGVPLSGKTEIFIHLVANTLQQGLHVLYLLPEIAITTRITGRLMRVFGSRLLVYHSGLSDHERVEVWNRLLYAKEPFVVVGVRSSLFLPLAHIGLVIVDHEHDASYRQQDPAPRYHARNVAMMLAKTHGAKTVLGSATPSLESYHHAVSGKYGFVALQNRYGNVSEPLVRVVDVKDLKRKKIMRETLFSPFLKEKMEASLQQNEQIVLFQNRRGYAGVMECKICGDVVRCVNCDVSLTCHKRSNRLVCHYCGYAVMLPSHCPTCNAKEIKLVGFGTETVEEEIAMLFPGVQTNRLDIDTAGTRSAYERILAGFEQGKSQILIGTQMLAKGLDFSNVGVTGILHADSLMNIPDFRAHERAFQLISQVCNRVGLTGKQATVVIQTSQPAHPLIQAIQTFNYEQMAKEQLAERKAFRYPPYYRLIVLILRGPNEQSLEQMTIRYAEQLIAELGERVLPPFSPPINRVQTLFTRHIMLKIETTLSTVRVRSILDKIHCQMQTFPGYNKVMLHYEVDN